MTSAAAKALEIVRNLETGNDVRQVVSCSEGGRAFRLLKKREDNRAKAEAAKAEIENETKKRKFSSIDQKFGSSAADKLEEEFKNATVGLVSVEEFRAKRKAVDDAILSSQTQGPSGKTLRLQRKVTGSRLSFDDDDFGADDDDSDSDSDDEKPQLKKGFGKDPTVNTSFLYDAEREADIQRKKKEIIKEYKEEQEQAKKEKLEITYSYWDGSGHRRTTMVDKGYTIGQFLGKAKSELEKSDFPELRSVMLDSIMYVKEDLIIPHNVTFYALIKDKAKGKSGPLFNFDVHDDLRKSDVRVEKDESHAGKIVDRKWYERNKHIFPASRWEVYAKDKTYDQYTISGNTDHSRPMT